MIERNLVLLVIGGAVLAVALPELGIALVPLVTPLLALLILCVSLTFDLAALREALARPGAQALSTFLVYVPMGLAGFLLGRVAFGSTPLGVGFALLGVLPTDVSSPLLVWLARGNVALATVMNAINTSLAPVLVPVLLVGLTGVELDVGLSAVVGELALVVLAPTALGVVLRTWRPRPIRRVEPALSAVASMAYVVLLIAVLGPNADRITASPGMVALVAALSLALNGIGYGLGAAAGRLLPALLPDPADRTALLFTVSKKEFSIAAFVVVAAGLSPEVALPAAVFAVVQMLTSPLVARRLARRV